MTKELNNITFDDLDNTQKNAVNLIVNTNKNVFIQGQAGTGKSAVIKVAETICKNKNKKVMLLSFTGLAAENIGGVTINSQFMIAPRYLYNKNSYQEVNDAIGATDVIIIDEISMVTPDLFEVIDRLCKIARKNTKLPFGGIQMVLVGDVYQLGPFHSIDKDEHDETIKQKQKQDIEKYFKSICGEEYGKKYWHFGQDGKTKEPDEPYFFDTQAYINGNFEKIHLIKVHRQQNDVEFLRNLFNISRGKNIDEALQYFNKNCVTALEPANSTIISTRRKETEEENQNKYSKLSGPEYCFIMNGSWVFPSIIKKYEHAGKDANYIDRLKRSTPGDDIEKELKLRIGAVVMFVKNNRSAGYVNGTIGIVENFKKNTDTSMIPIVKIIKGENKGRTIDVYPITFEHEIYTTTETGELKKEKIGEITQIPLKLAFALTVHKSQGQTLENVYIKTRNSFWGYGQLYVALSRVKKLHDLKISRPITTNDVRVSQRVKDFLGDTEEDFQYDYDDLQQTDTDPLLNKISILENSVRDILEQILGLKQEILATKYNLPTESTNILTQQKNTDITISATELPDSCDINTQIEKIFNKYGLSVNIIGSPEELVDMAEKKKASSIFNDAMLKNTEQINMVNKIYTKNGIKHSDVFKARLFVPDTQDRITLLNLLEKRDNITITDKTRIVLVEKYSYEKESIEKKKFYNWFGKGNAVHKLLYAYFICCAIFGADKVTKDTLFNICQQKGYLHLDRESFFDIFNKISGLNKQGISKQLFVIDNDVVYLANHVKPHIKSVYNTYKGLSRVANIDEYLDLSQYSFIEQEKLNDIYLSQEETNYIVCTDIADIQLQKDFFAIFKGTETNSFKLIKAYFDIVKNDKKTTVQKTDLLTKCCTDENSSMYIKPDLFLQTLTECEQFIITDKDSTNFILNNKYKKLFECFYTKGFFIDSETTQEDEYRIKIKNLPINELVKQYFIPAIQKTNINLNRLTDALYNNVDFGFSPVLTTNIPYDKEGYIIKIYNKDYYVPKDWDEEHKDKLLTWLKNEKIINI